MRININVKEDEQLRREIREIIKGQVVSIVRKQVKELIIETMSGEEGKKFTAARLEELANSEISDHIRKFANSTPWSGDGKNIEKLARVEIHNILREMRAYIREQIKKQVGSFIKDEISAVVSEQVSAQIKTKIAQILGGQP